MIAGEVTPARMDLRNQDLVKAHLHSEWLAIVKLGLGRQMVDILDLDDPEFPILSDKLAYLQGEPHSRYAQEAIVVARKIVDRAPEVKEAFQPPVRDDGEPVPPEQVDEARKKWEAEIEGQRVERAKLREAGAAARRLASRTYPILGLPEPPEPKDRV